MVLILLCLQQFLAIAKLQLLKQNFKVFGNWIELIIMTLFTKRLVKTQDF